jgi:hypothetical protein
VKDVRSRNIVPKRLVKKVAREFANIANDEQHRQSVQQHQAASRSVCAGGSPRGSRSISSRYRSMSCACVNLIQLIDTKQELSIIEH